MFEAKIDFPERTRSKAVERLNARLADCIDIQNQTRQTHRNVKEPNFTALHELFDKVNEAVEEYVDEWEWPSDAAGRYSPAKYQPQAADGRGHVEALSSALAALGRAWKAIGEVNDLRDLDADDLLAEVSRGLDKWLWFVEAHLHAER